MKWLFGTRFQSPLWHRHIGNLDERDAHEVLTWTVAECQAAGFWGELYYRTYRSAPEIYFFGPIFIFFIRYRIPKSVKRVLTSDVVYHDLHHLYVKIPAYRLKACHEALADELQPTRMGWGEAIACVKWKLWDEDAKRMVLFCDMKQSLTMQPAE